MTISRDQFKRMKTTSLFFVCTGLFIKSDTFKLSPKIRIYKRVELFFNIHKQILNKL